MLENPGDERRLCNGRDDTHGPTAAARTASQIDREHPAQPLHPAHRGAGLDLLERFDAHSPVQQRVLLLRFISPLSTRVMSG